MTLWPATKGKRIDGVTGAYGEGKNGVQLSSIPVYVRCEGLFGGQILRLLTGRIGKGWRGGSDLYRYHFY